MAGNTTARPGTTNDLLARVLEDIGYLIAWADGDADASYDSDAHNQERDDLERAVKLRVACAIIEECRR